MTRYPGALWRPISRNKGGRRASTRGVILHVAASEAASLQGWFNNPQAGASSHLYVRRDGTVEQYVDARDVAWASGKANPTTIGVETQGMGSGEWTPAQVEALAQIVAWAHREFGVPLRVMTSSKASERGVGYHLLGVPKTTAQKILGRSQTGGELWSKAVGKICPGPDRVKQVPGIVERARQLVGGAPPKPSAPGKSKPAPAPAPSSEPRTYAKLVVDGVRGVRTVTAWQVLLKYVAQPRRYSGRVDGVYGPLSNKAEQSWLAALGFYKGRIDGVRGPVHKKALQSFLRKKGLYGGRIDGVEGPLTVKAEQRYLNDQRKYL